MKKKIIHIIKRLQTNTLRKVLAVLIVAAMLFALLPTLPVLADDVPQITAHQFSALVSEIENGLSEAELIERGGASEASGKSLKAELIKLPWGAAAQYWVEGYENCKYTVCVNSARKMEESTDNVVYSGFLLEDGSGYMAIKKSDVPTLTDDYLLEWGRVAAYDKTTGEHYRVVVSERNIPETIGDYTVSYQAMDAEGSPIGGEFTLPITVADNAIIGELQKPVYVFITPTSETVEKGTSLTLSGTAIYVMNMMDGKDDDVTYSITSTVTDSDTTIDPSTGKLTVGAGENAKEITVKATSNVDNTAFAEAKITVVAGPLITLTHANDGHGYTKYMLKGDANLDKKVDYKDIDEINEYIKSGKTPSVKATFDSCDVNSDGAINADDVTLLTDLLAQGTLPDSSLTFEVIDIPVFTYYRIDTVSVNDNELTVPDDFLKSEDTTVDGITYTVAIDKNGKVTVSGQSLAENNFYFTHKSAELTDFAGELTGDLPTYVYDGLAHEPGDIHLMRLDTEVIGVDQLSYAFVRQDPRVIKYGVNGSWKTVYTDDSVAFESLTLTKTNWPTQAQKTIDYFTDWNTGDKPEFTEAGDYQYVYGFSMQGDPNAPTGINGNSYGVGHGFPTLKITKRPITITASKTSNLAKYTISGDKLAANQKIKSITTDTSTSDTTITNTVSNAVIIDAEGNDVTKNYDITYVPSTLTEMVQVRVGIYITNDNGQYPNADCDFYPYFNIAGYSQVKRGETAKITQDDLDKIDAWSNYVDFSKYDIDTENSLFENAEIGTPSDEFPDDTTLNTGVYNEEFAPTGPTFSEFVYLRVVLKDKEKYTIVYDGNGCDGGTVPKDDTVYKTGDTVTIPMDVPTKTGYTFKCWKVNPEYQPGDTFIFDTVHANKANESNVVTLTAQWTLNAPKTGDNSNVYLLAGLMLVALSGAVILLIVSKRKNKA